MTAIDTSPEAVEQLAMEYSYSHGMDLIVAATLRALSGELARAREQVYNWRHAAHAKQAKIDALMLEYCPGEMTQEQRDEWARNQLPARSQGPSHG